MQAIDGSLVLGLIAVALCWAFAVLLFRVGSTGSGSRKLATLMVVEGITLITNVSGGYLEAVGYAEKTTIRQINYFLHTLGDCLLLALYPSFLAAALKTKLTQPFAGKWSRVLLWGFSGLLLLTVSLDIFTNKTFSSERMIPAMALYASLTVMFTFALVASVHAWRTAPPGIIRDQARSFVLAFCLRDICWGFVYAMSILWIMNPEFFSDNEAHAISFIYRLSTLIYIPFIAYGILRTKLFDIDLRIQWTLKQSTIASVFIAVMFVVSEGASQFLSDEIGAVSGLLAAGVLVFFIAPLQQFAERVASSAMPNTKNTAEYTTFRKMQVYESALIEAQYEDGVSERERALLDHLRESLGISITDAQAIELELKTS